jgi:HEAT repeat protein
MNLEQQRAFLKSRLHPWLVLCLALGLALSSLQAADSPQTVAARASSIVAEFPGRTAADTDALAARLVSLGPEGIQAVCLMLAPPGPEDDTRARFALNGLVNYVSSPRREPQRKILLKSLAKALERERSKDVQAFLISQIQLAGDRASVKILRKYLKDQRLCEPATRALVSIGTPDAETAFLKALGSARGSNKVALIEALGQMRSRKATKKLMAYARSEAPEVRRAALYALANAGDPLAMNVLNKSFLQASLLERTQAPLLYLHYLGRLSESGTAAKIQAVRILRSLIKDYAAPRESQVSCAALSALFDVIGKNALGDILNGLDSAQRDIRGKALELASRLENREVTVGLIEKTAGASPDVQAEIITALGLRGDRTALPLIMEKLNSRDKTVGLAAIPAAARLGREEAAPSLFAALESDDNEERDTAEQALLGFSKDQVVPRAASLLGRAAAPTQAALVRIMAARGAKEYADLVFAKTESGDEAVRLAALAALESLAGEKDLSRLIALLMKTGASREITLIQRAVVAASNLVADAEARADPVLLAARAAPAEKRAALVACLPKIGGKKALEEVVLETQSPDSKVQTAAVYALSQWSDFAAAEPLLHLCRTADSRKFLNLAFRGFVRLVEMAEISSGEKFDLFSEALSLPAGPAEKKIVLSGLSDLKTMDSLRLAASYLGNLDLKTTAAQAVAGIALPSPGKEDGLAGIEAIRALKAAAEIVPDEDERRRIGDYARALLLEEGFRPLFNGRDLAGWKGLVADPPGRAKMSAAELSKAQAEADADMRIHWQVVDGVLVFDGAGHNLCTPEDYGDFELFIDWKIGPNGDSGIYLRGSPQVQIWDPAQWPEGSGGLYNNQNGPNKPLQQADNPAGAWNTFYVRMSGNRVTVYLNNILVVNDVAMENYWEREKPLYSRGQIELQAHSTPLAFRDIYLRELQR